ncbi:MAG: AbrB/MazE/SpoVT family DNA-binding domain-containing protein [Candidatus Micrarchaeia archaeon]
MVEVYERGQIVIPKYIRDMLKITPGTNLNVNVEGGKIVLEKYDPVKELEKIRAKHAIYTTDEVDKLMTKLEKRKVAEVMKNVH